MKVVFGLVLFLSSMQLGFANEVDLDKLAERVKARWSEMSSHDYGSAYEFETPKYRKFFTKKMFVTKYGYGIDWLDVKINAMKYSPDAGTAIVTLSMLTKAARSKEKGVRVIMHEKWLADTGEWWYGASLGKK